MARGENTAGHPNRQVHPERFRGPGQAYGGSADAQMLTMELRNERERLEGFSGGFKSWNATSPSDQPIFHENIKRLRNG